MKYYVTYNPDTEKFDLRDKEQCKTIFSSVSRGRCTAKLEEIVQLDYKPDLERVYYLVDRMDEALKVIHQRNKAGKELTEYDLRRALHIHTETQLALGITPEYP